MVKLYCPGDVCLTIQYQGEAFDVWKAAAVEKLHKQDPKADASPANWAFSKKNIHSLDNVKDDATVEKLSLGVDADLTAIFNKEPPSNVGQMICLYALPVAQLQQGLKKALAGRRNRAVLADDAKADAPAKAAVAPKAAAPAAAPKVDARADAPAKADAVPKKGAVKNAAAARDVVSPKAGAAAKQPKKVTNGTTDGSLASFLGASLGANHQGASSGMIKRNDQADEEAVAYHKNKAANKEMAKAFGEMVMDVAKTQEDRAKEGKVLSASQIAKAQRGQSDDSC